MMHRNSLLTIKSINLCLSFEIIDAPIALSGAHFLDSYEKYQDMVVGLKPERAKHETVLDIEPVWEFANKLPSLTYER